FSCPNGTPEVVAAEELAAAAYQERHGVPHPFLCEHAQFGIPAEAEVRTILSELDCSFAVFDNAPLDAWMTMLLASESLCEQDAPAELHEQLARICRSSSSAGAAVPYRKIYVCTKTLASSAALESDERPVWAEPRPAIARGIACLGDFASQA